MSRMMMDIIFGYLSKINGKQNLDVEKLSKATKQKTLQYEIIFFPVFLICYQINNAEANH